MITQRVAIVIPALNEEAALCRLLAELPRTVAQWIIVVDNGSRDATAAVAQDAGVLVASEPTQGYGLACLKGFKQERGGSMSDTALVVMARYPQVGKTKTRLAHTIGDDETVRLYRAFLTDLAQRFAGQPCDLYWAYTPAEVDYHAFVATLTPAFAQHMRCFPQQGADLGARLLNVFRWTQARQFERTIVTSSDSPQISREIVAQAREALHEADVVLGPAEDGGYYLIAMRKPYDVFSGVPMSTSVVMQRTIELAERQGLSVRLLEPLFDIDELSDLLRLAQLLEADRTLAPVTAAHLALRRSLYDNHISRYAATFDLHRADQPV